MLKRLALACLVLAAPAMALAPQATPVAGSNVLIDHSGTITLINITTGASAGRLVVVDQATIPADGTIRPAFCLPVASTTGIVAPITPDGLQVNVGAAVMFSTGADCFTLVKSATAFISVGAR